ncbi:FmdB family zinc ribbon protein [Nocardia mangyaensis]|uniref:FmdB family zinc ribbon protein n=1 Tax=Nocardia mangyaensis TaxID=2213200 RepID=UPI001F0A1545|nr:zinc ribbon domain-containing protein [Nocardia mangyaensis]
MPNYSFRCRSCGDTFEVNRPMAQSSDAAACPAGHDDTVKLLTTFATVSRGAAPHRLPHRAPLAADAAVPAVAADAGAVWVGGRCSPHRSTAGRWRRLSATVSHGCRSGPDRGRGRCGRERVA